MDNIIEINNLSFSYEENKILDNLNFSLKRGTWLTLIGNNGSGKSTLIRMITGLIPSNRNIKVNNLVVEPNNYKEIRNIIGVVFENPNNQLIGETVIDSMAFGLENMCFDSNDIMNTIKETAELLKITNLLNKSIENLSGGEKQLVALASVLVMRPRILILDEALTMIDTNEKTRILKVLTKIHNKSGITILNVTHDIEESIYGEEIAIINKGKILISSNKEEVYNNEKLLKQVGLELPFTVNLSKKLSYYHLLDKTIYDIDEMVDILWK